MILNGIRQKAQGNTCTGPFPELTRTDDPVLFLGQKEPREGSECFQGKRDTYQNAPRREECLKAAESGKPICQQTTIQTVFPVAVLFRQKEKAEN